MDVTVQHRFGIGLIGTGGIAGAHAQAYRQLGKQCELRGIAELDAAKARLFAEEWRLDAPVYADYRQLLAQEDIDVVSICTPPYAREELVVSALAAGKHVMCEKPIAASLEELDRMLDAARTHNRKLGVMLQTRCETDVRRARELVASGAIGEVVYARAANHHWRGDTYYRKEWRGTWEKERGGTLMNLGIHTLDVFLWALGELDSVTAAFGTLGHAIETDDVNAATLKFRSGAIGQFACTTTFAESGSMMEFGSKSSMVRCSPFEAAAVRENEDGFPIQDGAATAELERLAGEVEPVIDGFAGPIADLFAAILENRETLTGGLEVRRTLEAVTAIYKAATIGGEVKLPITKDDPWYTTEGMHRLVKKPGAPSAV